MIFTLTPAGTRSGQRRSRLRVEPPSVLHKHATRRIGLALCAIMAHSVAAVVDRGLQLYWYDAQASWDRRDYVTSPERPRCPVGYSGAGLSIATFWPHSYDRPSYARRSDTHTSNGRLVPHPPRGEPLFMEACSSVSRAGAGSACSRPARLSCGRPHRTVALADC